MADRAVRYGMIVLDAAPTIVRARGGPVFFSSPDETMEYAVVHAGRRQAATLARLGHTESTLTVAMPGMGSSAHPREGHAAPERDHLSLLIERTDASDQLELT